MDRIQATAGWNEYWIAVAATATDTYTDSDAIVVLVTQSHDIFL